LRESSGITWDIGTLTTRPVVSPEPAASSGESPTQAQDRLEADAGLSFDIVSPIRSGVAEAELLDVVDKVISEFRGMRGSAPVDYEFHISHESGERGSLA
jgi:hypothetical protein